MSFILDALKKSESARERQSGPALFEVKVARPRAALPPWAVAIAVLFVINLAVVGWLLMRHTATPAVTAPTPQAPARTQAAPAPAAPATAAGAIDTPAAASPTASPVAAVSAAPASQPAGSPAARSTVTPAVAPAAGAAQESASNPDDFAAAVEPPASGTFGRVKRGTEAGVPLYQQVAGTPGSRLPQLRLDLHAYAERAGDRWVLVNMHKLHEGDSLEGVRVDRITPDGAILSYQGSQFLLPRE